MKSCNDQYAPCKAVFRSAFVPVQVRNHLTALVIEDLIARNMTNTGRKLLLKPVLPTPIARIPESRTFNP
jgi:hypothetical protein